MLSFLQEPGSENSEDVNPQPSKFGGQGFADEVFRVFMKNQPEISMEITNLKPSLRPIIEHVVDNKIRKRLTIS